MIYLTYILRVQTPLGRHLAGLSQLATTVAQKALITQKK